MGTFFNILKFKLVHSGMQAQNQLVRKPIFAVGLSVYISIMSRLSAADPGNDNEEDYEIGP